MNAPKTTGATIRIQNLSKIYVNAAREQSLVLDRISLDISPGEFITLVGPSGCGKSTLLKVIGGVEDSTAGKISINGEAVFGARSGNGFAFQAATLLPWFNVRENILFPVSGQGIEITPLYQNRLDHLLEISGLSTVDRKYPRELSGGMQQRVAICRSLIQEPDLLLLDEPFGALDALTRETLSMELLKICADSPKTVIFVTHSIPEAVFLADRVVVMGAHPWKIARVIDIDFPRPRSFDVMDTPAFGKYASEIRNLIFGKPGAES